MIDSGGGFLIQEDLINDNKSDKQPEAESSKVTSTQQKTTDEVLPLPITYESCLECAKQFAESYLLKNFAYAVCDGCRDGEGKHSLITRTEAKNDYLLKDCDFDAREPPLKFITRKNPHNERWGEMKLYLHLMIEKRALEVWGSEEELLRQKEQREEQRDKAKLKKYNKNMKILRMEMRSSLYDRTSKTGHTHTYGEETYHEDEDNYTHACTICDFVETFEKM